MPNAGRGKEVAPSLLSWLTVLLKARKLAPTPAQVVASTGFVSGSARQRGPMLVISRWPNAHLLSAIIREKT
eukprot:2259556-Pyramimonas_sp.AAC.1